MSNLPTHTLACMNYISDGYTTDDILIRWANKSALEFSPSLTREHGLPEFKISGNDTGDCTAVYATGKNNHLQCRHLIPALNETACPIATQFHWHDLSTRRSFYLQERWVIGVLGLFLTCYLRAFV